MKRSISFILVLLIALSSVCACTGSNTKKDSEFKVMHEEKFGGIYFDITIDEFNALGYSYGDSVDITFSNGEKLEDLPYYNGYYVDIGDPLLVAYPGYPNIEAAINYGEDPWISLGLDENCTAVISLNERGKYLRVQEARDIKYSDEQGSQSDEVFGNFREVDVGNLKKGILYRSASPCNNEHCRAAVVDRLAEEAKIGFIINLSDTDEDIAGFIAEKDFASPYFLSLYNDGKVAPLGLSANFKSESFSSKLAEGLIRASENDGPYLVHCVEGKDRTGYVMMILEALAGATYVEIIDDYMLTYNNYYGINKDSDKDRYVVIKDKNIDAMICYVTGLASGVDFESIDLEPLAFDYLVKAGMTEEQVKKLQDKLTGAAE